MDRRHVDRAFARFCRTGDPAALALVFDATAPELLRVARHLVRDPGEAEDLVQSVFLAAIEHRRAHRSTAGALPWLLGILANLARRRRRAAQRRLDLSRLAVHAEADPAERAAALELHAALRTAVRSLPQPYRAVVERHVVGGASAREIAVQLGRAAGTVRTQLARGLEHLRRALPASLGGTGAGLLAARPGPAAMRAVVLEAARRAAPIGSAAAAAPGVAGIGALSMQHVLLAGAALLAVLATWMVWPSQTEPGSESLTSLATPSGADRLGESLASVPPRVPVQHRGMASVQPPGSAGGAGDDGCAVRGRVVDTRGRPVAGARVRLSYRGTSRRAVSGADGAFACAQPLGPAHWQVEHDAFGVRERGPDLEIGRGQRSAELVLVLAAAEDRAWLAGLVVDDAGAPVAGAEVRIESRRAISLGSVQTSVAGVFRIARPADVPEAAVRIHARREGYDEAWSAERCAWGEENVRLVLGRSLSAEIVVVDARTGAPVEDYGVQCFRDPLQEGGDDAARALRDMGNHAGGRLRVANLLRGRQLLRVEPASRELAPSPFRGFDLDDRGAPLQRVALAPAIPHVVRVVDGGGAPVGGASVELLSAIRDVPVRVDARVIDAAGLEGMAQTLSRLDPEQLGAAAAAACEVLLLAQGVTDARSELAMSVAPQPRLALRVWSKGCAPVVRDRVDLTPAAPVVVALARGAVLEGVLRPPELAAFRPVLHLIDATDPLRQIAAARVADDGWFRAEGIAPGSWVVHLRFRHSGVDRLDRVAAIDALRDGEMRRMTIEAPQLVPGELAGRAVLGGDVAAGRRLRLAPDPPPAQGQLRVRGSLASPGAGVIDVELDDGGAFAVALMPGRYRVAVVPRDGGAAPFFAAVELAPGARVERCSSGVRGGRCCASSMRSGNRSPGARSASRSPGSGAAASSSLARTASWCSTPLRPSASR